MSDKTERRTPPQDENEEMTVLRPLAQPPVAESPGSEDAPARAAPEPGIQGDKTMLRTVQEASATMLRPPADERTGVHAATAGSAAGDGVGASGPGAAFDAATMVDPAADQRAGPGAPTFARTLRAPGIEAGGGSAYAATLQAPAGAATEIPGSRRREGTLAPGSVIKQRFVLESLLGKGGMGLVFGAIDRRKQEAQDPNPRVALKVLNSDFERHPQSFMALQREARKAQTLAHPNVVTVFDFDRDGDTVYMTMELLQGRSLDSIVREARGKGIGREAALPIIRGIAEGLAYAHRKGIVHSDLKPGNVFIAADGTTKILDFGIARAVPNSATEENPDVFDAGSLGAYTEAYATDEMVDGIDPHPADDMYALGLIAYELVSGFHPYQRHSAPNARKLGIKPAPLKGLKRREARAIEACLSFDRKQRPQDATAFLKVFRGVTALQQATLAAVAILALMAGYLWYQNYVEIGPTIAFSELSLEDQREFNEYMTQGDESWAFFERDHIADALPGAIEWYARAYEVHQRNRRAVAALNRAADALLAAAGPDREQRGEWARNLQRQSPHFLRYAPVIEAAKY